MRRAFVFLAVLLPFILPSFASQNPEKPPTVVRIVGYKFVPEQVKIKAGDTVEWVAEPDGPSHEITTDADKAMDPSNVSIPKGASAFDSGKIKPGKSYRQRFTVAGTYHYACPPHEMHGMVGQIVVEP